MMNAGSIMVDWGEEKKMQIAGRLRSAGIFAVHCRAPM